MRTIYLSVVLLFCVSLHAQNAIQFVQDNNGSLQIEETKKADFKPFKNQNQGLDNGIYWFRIVQSSQEQRVLEIPSAHVNEAKLFSASGIPIEEISYTRYPAFRLGNFEEYPLYLKLNLEKEAFSPIQVTSAEDFAKANQQALFKLGSYYGFALMVIIINFMCYFLFDEKVFFYYCAVLSTVTASFFYSDGLFRLFGMDNVFVNQYLEPILHLAVAIFGAHFATKFLRLEEERYRFMKWVSVALLTVATTMFSAYWVTNEWVFAATANTVIWSVLLMYLIAGATLFRKKVYARFYVISYSLLFVMMIDYYVLSGFGISFLDVSAYQLKIAGVFEMLVLTYAITYRMRALKEENELMQVEMRLYLKRIELLRSPDNIQMVDDMYLENLVNLHDLNNLETKLLQYISRGKDNAKIATKLNISEKEVEKLTKSLYKKLEISEQIQEDHRMVEEQPDYIYN